MNPTLVIGGKFTSKCNFLLYHAAKARSAKHEPRARLLEWRSMLRHEGIETFNSAFERLLSSVPRPSHRMQPR